jgi:hypothetical protein
MCFAHSTREQRQKFLSETKAAGKTLQLDGTTISQELWNEIKDSPVFEDSRPVVPISLVGADIKAEVRFVNCEFNHSIDLTGATVWAMRYTDCVFTADYGAQDVLFKDGRSHFEKCTFKRNLDISYSQSDGATLSLNGCTFKQSLIATGFYGGPLYIVDATITGNVSLAHAKANIMGLVRTQIEGSLDLEAAEFSSFHGDQLTLTTARQLGPFRVGKLNLAHARFGSVILIEVSAEFLNFSGAVFDGGGSVLIDRAKVELDRVISGERLHISARKGFTERPEIRTLRDADASKMSFAHVKMSRCSFQRVRGLGTVEIASTVRLEVAPWWKGKRRFIADEYAYRKTFTCWCHSDWKVDGVQVEMTPSIANEDSSPDVLVEPLPAADLASIYRDLRRSLEAKSDMPAASDFYYGEMEMRRLENDRPFVEKILLFLYWAICGYGLRPARTIAWWTLLTVVGAWFIYSSCCAVPNSPLMAILGAVRAAIPGFPIPPAQSLVCASTEIILRVFGTLLIALFLLAARSLVMRKPSD